MMANQVIANHDWIGTVLTAVVIPVAFGAATLVVLWLDGRTKMRDRKGT
jgi:hypothetical protein